MCGGSEDKVGKKAKNEKKGLNSYFSGQSKVPGSLRRCLSGRQLAEGHGERAWILPLGFSHSPLGPQNSNDFLFFYFKRGFAHQNNDEADADKDTKQKKNVCNKNNDYSRFSVFDISVWRQLFCLCYLYAQLTSIMF